MRKLSTERYSTPRNTFEPGPAPILDWIEIDKLVVDESYQREIGRRGAQNVALISECFEWSKFAPVIVAAIPGGQFAIVDGQHRTTAAMLRGIDRVPCQMVQADSKKQAAAFAAVNGNVTKTTSTQLFFAKLAAGDEQSKAVAEACLAAGVKIVRTNKSNLKMTPGQTAASPTLGRCLAIYGHSTLVAALRCVTRTADGNAGFLRSTIIEAMCAVVHEHPEWAADEKALHSHMDKFSFPDAWSRVAESGFPSAIKSEMISLVSKHLMRRFSAPVKKAA